MDGNALDLYHGGGGVEVLKFDLSHSAAVGRVGEVRPEALNVKAVRTAAHLFVGGDADADGHMGGLVPDQLLHSREDLRHAGLVVGAQKGGAVGDDQMLADAARQPLKILCLHHDVLLGVEHNISAGVFQDPGLHVLAGAVGRGVHVGNQTDDRALHGAGDGAVDVAVLVHPGVGHADGLQILHNGRAQQLLLQRGGTGFAVLIGLGVEGDVVQKAFGDIHSGILLCMV